MLFFHEKKFTCALCLISLNNHSTELSFLIIQVSLTPTVLSCKLYLFTSSFLYSLGGNSSNCSCLPYLPH